MPERSIPEKPTSLALSPADALVELNLVRAWWILIASTSCTVLFTISDYLTGTTPAFVLVQTVDYVGSTVSLILFWLARRGRFKGKVRQFLPINYALFFVLVSDAYYFSGWPVAGDNVGYAFGVLTPAALLYLRPAIFTPFLLGNCLFVCAMITKQPVKLEVIASGIYGATIIMVIAVISSIIHYRSKVAELEKTALIARRNLELAASNSSLLAMSQRMDETMALAAHDLRAPLLGMASLCEMERAKPEWRDQEQIRIFSVIQQGANRMVTLVNNMLAEYSARHHSIAGLTLVPCDLGPIFRHAADQAEPLALRKNIELAWPGFSTIALAEANPEALDRVFGNLISNAIKYSPAGSRVELAIERKGAHWICEVRDEGPGIPLRDRATLFNKLQKGTNLPTSGEESTGLGLYIARKLVETMNGTIEFQPGSEGGSIFRIALKAV